MKSELTLTTEIKNKTNTVQFFSKNKRKPTTIIIKRFKEPIGTYCTVLFQNQNVQAHFS